MNKKALLSGIAGALMLTAAGTGFAASNPFSDVPEGSWAYEAVAQLAADGVIDGYADGTYQGQNKMTRYEMAQITARAMSRTDLDKADKAAMDKLSAEFAEELDNLGVRVAELEKKSDSVVWGGKLKYKYYQRNHDVGKDKRANEIKLRLEPKAYIGDSGWTAKARIEYKLKTETSSNAETDVTRAYVQGPLGGTTLTAGLLPVEIAQGAIFDDTISGVRSEFGSDVFNTQIYAGRYSENGHEETDQRSRDITAEYYGTQFDYTPSDKLAFNAGYIRLSGLDEAEDLIETDGSSANIWYAGTDWEFADNLRFVGEFVQNTDADRYGDSYFMDIRYKGAKNNDPGSWGMYAGYRSFGKNAAIEPDFDDADANQKGFAVGADYTFAKNIVGSLKYFRGKDIDKDTDADSVFGELVFRF